MKLNINEKTVFLYFFTTERNTYEKPCFKFTMLDYKNCIFLIHF